MDEKYVVLQTTWKRMNPFLGLLRTEHALCGQWTATIRSSACQFALIRLQVPKSEKLHIQFLISKSDSEKKKILLNKKKMLSVPYHTYAEFYQVGVFWGAVCCTLPFSLLCCGRKCNSSSSWNVYIYEWVLLWCSEQVGRHGIFIHHSLFLNLLFSLSGQRKFPQWKKHSHLVSVLKELRFPLDTSLFFYYLGWDGCFWLNNTNKTDEAASP